MWTFWKKDFGIESIHARLDKILNKELFEQTSTKYNVH